MTRYSERSRLKEQLKQRATKIRDSASYQQSSKVLSASELQFCGILFDAGGDSVSAIDAKMIKTIACVVFPVDEVHAARHAQRYETQKHEIAFGGLLEEYAISEAAEMVLRRCARNRFVWPPRRE